MTEYAIFWTNGDQCQYTGKTEIKHGTKWFEFAYINGHLKGTTAVTSRCPDCEMFFFHDQPANNECLTCKV